MKKTGQDILNLECKCASPAHLLRVVYEPGQPSTNEDPKLHLAVQFPVLPFHKRVIVALRYVFGVQRSWTDHCLTDESIVGLRKVIAKYRLITALRHALRARKARKETERGKSTNGLDNPS